MAETLASIAALVHSVATALHGPVAALLGTIGDIAANRPEPARQTITVSLVTVAGLWLTFKIVKLARKGRSA